jgi:hypothetical protein
LDDLTRQEVLKDAPIGQIYRQEVLNQLLAKYTSVFKLRPDDPRLLAKKMDEKSGTVSITIFACPCATCELFAPVAPADWRNIGNTQSPQ